MITLLTPTDQVEFSPPLWQTDAGEVATTKGEMNNYSAYSLYTYTYMAARRIR